MKPESLVRLPDGDAISTDLGNPQQVPSVGHDFASWIACSGTEPRHLAAARAALTRLEERYRVGAVPFLTALHAGPPSPAYLDVGRCFADQAKVVVHFGCGGSMHAGKVFALAARKGTGAAGTAPEIEFLGSIDPDQCLGLQELLERTGADQVYSVFSSKSGHTTETLAHFAMMLEWYGRTMDFEAIRKRTICISQARPSPLRALAKARGIPVLSVPEDVGGRFAAFTVSGLLPAIIAGEGADSPDGGTLAGGRAVLADAFPKRGLSLAARSAAAMAAFLERHETAALTTLAYGTSLDPLQAWYRQLVAESLGKDGRGFFPITAHGTDDEHSQLQMWLDGPPNQMFTLLRTPPSSDVGLRPETDGYPTWFPQRLRALWDAHADATAASLRASGRPFRIFLLGSRSRRNYAALMAHFMLETVLLADLLGIDPYGQPAVEGTKRHIVESLTGASR